MGRVAQRGSFVGVFIGPLVVLGVLACGARTGLGVSPPDASDDSPDGGLALDASVLPDAPADVAVEVAPDVAPPPECDDDATYIYAVSSQSDLFRFDPATSTFTLIGVPNCTSSSIPFSMAVDRAGTAYVLYRDGNLFRVSTETAECEPTGFSPGPFGWTRFGMGFVANLDGGLDTLFITDSSYSAPSQGLARLDTTTFEVSFVGAYSTYLGNAVELTGTSDGRLYAFGLPASSPPVILAEVDPTSAEVLSTDSLALGNPNASFAFAFWGGDFFLFVAPSDGAHSRVVRYRPSDGSLSDVAVIPAAIVGAGVSTCAPSER